MQAMITTIIIMIKGCGGMIGEIYFLFLAQLEAVNLKGLTKPKINLPDHFVRI